MPELERPRLRAWTVRSRIVGILTLLSLLTVFSAGGVAYLWERTRVIEQIESNLDAALESAGFVVGQQRWTSAEQALAAIVQRLAPDDNTGTLGILDGRARWEPFATPSVALDELPGFVDRVVEETAGHEVVIGTYVHEGQSIRYIAAPVTVGESDPSLPPPAVFTTGYDVGAQLAELDVAARIFTLTAFGATALAFLIGLLVSDRLLRPIRRIREVAERSSAASLAERIPVGSGRDDVSQLAITVNGMLDRLGGALASQRELLRDVGHELKTPLTIVRGHLELVDEHDAADVVATRDLAIDELDRMARLVDDLRAAARLRDPGAFDLRVTDVAALLDAIAHKAKAIDGAVIDSRVEAVAVRARLDPDRVTQAMLQFVANAVRHAEGPITIGGRVRDEALELFVRDRGPGVPDELKAVIFERFKRGVAEGRGDDGSGLGLAIVQIIAEGHDGSTRVVDADGGSEFAIVLPTALAAAGAASDAPRTAQAQPAAAAASVPAPSVPEPPRPGAATHPRTDARPVAAEASQDGTARGARAPDRPEEQPWHRS
ncbi:sensor histidine kinase [Agrococcus beijingensis]|uniref:sensor histidine kinase n=1 Tax=Agrococcus beijingensis TaxID=3068634 RepID=UPI002741E2AC|nr:HAMP domain-containing sensor histidine kinase [Agrococcus sp. REN33]